MTTGWFLPSDLYQALSVRIFGRAFLAHDGRRRSLRFVKVAQRMQVLEMKVPKNVVIPSNSGSMSGEVAGRRVPRLTQTIQPRS